MKQALYKGKVWYIYDTVDGYKLSRNGDFEILSDEEYDYAIVRGDIKMLEKKNDKNVIEIKEEVRIGNIILEKGDKIEVLEEVVKGDRDISYKDFVSLVASPSSPIVNQFLTDILKSKSPIKVHAWGVKGIPADIEIDDSQIIIDTSFGKESFNLRIDKKDIVSIRVFNDLVGLYILNLTDKSQVYLGSAMAFEEF